MSFAARRARRAAIIHVFSIRNLKGIVIIFVFYEKIELHARTAVTTSRLLGNKHGKAEHVVAPQAQRQSKFYID